MPFQIEKYHFNTNSVFEELPTHEKNLLNDHLIRKEEKKGKVIFRANSNSRGLYILRRGKVKIFQINKEGKEQIVYIYSKGEMMGYRPLLCNEPHPVTAVALHDCIMHFIPGHIFLSVLEQSSHLSRQLLVNLSHEFNVWINRITVFAQQPVLERVALSLLILNEKYRTALHKSEVWINLSREDLANYVGTTVETLVRMLRFLKDKKIIMAQGRKIMILKARELEKIAEL